MTDQAKSKPEPKAEPAEVFPLELRIEQITALSHAVSIAQASAIEQAHRAAGELINPSLFNPQPELWEQRKAEAVAHAELLQELLEFLAETVGAERPGPLFVITQTADGQTQVSGPAELNRPNGASPKGTVSAG